MLSNRCKYKRRLDLEQHNCTSFELCFVEIRCWNSKIVVGSIYRPPNTDPHEFIQSTKKVITQAKKQGWNLILGLDHNLDLLKESQAWHLRMISWKQSMITAYWYPPSPNQQELLPALQH